MGVTEISDFLRRHRTIALDTSAIIYQIEAHPAYVSLTHVVFLWVEERRHEAITSTITMTELLVRGYREDNPGKIDLYYGLLSIYPNLRWIPPDLETADLAARLRATHNLRTPDALQAATALCAGATGLITNDPAFLRVAEIETAVLDHYL